ncbi:MAG: cellulose binding domain-containing protein [Streptosporangiaceae bacterium]|jgi:hypothetical protein
MFGRIKSEQCRAGDEQPSSQPLALLDHPHEDETSGEPLADVDPPRTRSLRRRLAAAVAAIVLAVVMAGGGLLGAFSLSSSAGHRAFDGVTLTPAVLGHLRTAGAPVKPKAKPVHAGRVAAARRAPAKPSPLVVRYRIDDDSGNGFTAEVDITNNGSAAIAKWDLVLALPGDQITSWWNSGSGIALLTQPSWQGPVAGHGGVLRVYLNVTGKRTTPAACSVNGIKCGRA